MTLTASVGIQVRKCPFPTFNISILAGKVLVFFHVFRKDSKVIDFTTCTALPVAGWYKCSDVL
jgi:hypothetical protein